MTWWGSLADDIARRMQSDMDRAFLSTITNDAVPPRHSEPITAENIVAQIDRVISTIPPAPPTIVPAPWLVNRHEDWSRVRSLGRATRRMKRGHRQNVFVTETPKTEAYQIGGRVFVHPVMLAKARTARP